MPFHVKARWKGLPPSLIPCKVKKITKKYCSHMFITSQNQWKSGFAPAFYVFLPIIRGIKKRWFSSKLCFLKGITFWFGCVELWASRYQAVSHISSRPPEISLREVPMVHTKQCHSHENFPSPDSQNTSCTVTHKSVSCSFQEGKSKIVSGKQSFCFGNQGWTLIMYFNFNRLTAFLKIVQ